jgi:hypothetical protein
LTAARGFPRFALVLLLLGVLFCVGLALAIGTGALWGALGLLIAAFLLAVFIRLQSIAYIESTGVVRRVQVFDYYDIAQAFSVTVQVHGELATSIEFDVRDPPPVGSRVRMAVPIHRPWDAEPILAPDYPPLRGVTLLLGRRRGRIDRIIQGPRASRPRRRIELGPLGRLAGRPAWKATSYELVEVIPGLAAETVLNWQRRRCIELARHESLHTPEFIALNATFDVRWPTVAGRAFREQEPVFDATEDEREVALRRLVPLPFLAIAGIIVATVVLPPLLQVVLAGFDALLAGSTKPLLETVHWSSAMRSSGLPSADFVVILASAGVVAGSLALAGVRSVRRGRDAYRAWYDALAEVVRDRLRQEYQRVANVTESSTLLIRHAPGLAAVTVDQVVTRAETAQLRSLAFDLGAGAVAISGSRGVGKTTLLGMLTSHGGRTETLGVMVSAPVRYEPRDFLLHLYAQLCHAVLDRLGSRQSRWRRVTARTRRFTARLLRIASVLSLLLIVFTGSRTRLASLAPMPRLTATYLIVAIALYVLAFRVRGRGPTRELSLAAEAARRLRRTRFLQTVASEGSLGFAHSAFQGGWRRSRQWAEQPHSLPELVGDYRDFVAEVAAWWQSETDGRGKLLIAIDEADRIADPQMAEQFVNEIKATFGVPDCVYLVSVSEEALANFERRVVRMRTVFDSAFDHVVRLRPLSLRESVDLLRHRVSGVPDPFWILCHCMAGGMPRDVLRMARGMLDWHLASPGPTDLPAMAKWLVATEVEAVKRGFQHQAAAEPDQTLPELLADAEWPGTDLAAAAEEQLVGGSATATAIAAALLYYATVLEIFMGRPEVVRSLRLAVEEAAMEVTLVSDLALVHGLLAFDPPVAIQRLRGIREGLARE